MIKPLQIRNLTLGDGVPKICVPIVARNEKELEASLAVLSDVPFDLAEFRADHFEPLQELCLSAAMGHSTLLPILLKKTLGQIREVIGPRPLLFTVRTAAEGGMVSISWHEYEILLLGAAHTGMVDLIDMEWATAGVHAPDLIRQAHACQVRVLISSHDFSHTPSKKHMRARLLAMQETGADITKLAVMPQNRQDVISLLHITCEMADNLADRPYVTMSMSQDGMISRISGQLTGSAITFASAGAGSAPGQLSAPATARILKLLSGAAGKDIMETTFTDKEDPRL